jgi:hypothetical protein
MNITINLSSWIEDRLIKRATLQGKTVEMLAVEIIENALEGEENLDAHSAKPTFIINSRTTVEE